jgi:hypothetical protein
MGLMPRVVTSTGKRMGEQIRIRGAMSMMQPSTILEATSSDQLIPELNT